MQNSLFDNVSVEVVNLAFTHKKLSSLDKLTFK